MHFIFYIDGSSYRPMYEAMLNDLTARDDVTIISDIPNDNMIKKLLLKRKIQFLTKGCCDFLGYEENNLFKEIKKYCDSGEQVIVCFFNGALHFNEYLKGTLLRYKNIWKNLKYILYYTDIINSAVSRNAYYLQKNNIFDKIYTVDEADSIRYSIKLWPTLYSIDMNYSCLDVNKDIYFCGVSKGRSDILKKCLMEANKLSINVLMDIVCYNDAGDYDGFEDSMNIRTPNQYLSYPEVLKNELSAKCILDIVQIGQVALTLRPYEAVAYNKKLLTNNRTILKFKYYNPQYMKFFDKVEDIDWDWVTRDEEVNYKYEDSFSPKKFLEELKRSI